MSKDIDFKIDCWYKLGCPLLKPNCQKTCHRYLEMNYLINNCGKPNASKYIKPIIPDPEDEDAFMRLDVIRNNIEQFVKEGSNLYITSPYDKNGKTTWAVKLLYRYFDRVWSGNGFRVRGYFIYAPDFFSDMRSFTYKDTEEFKELKQTLYNADLVIWDDITSTKLSTVDQNNLNMFLNKRSQNDKSNIFTGYHTGENLVEQVGELAAKRLTYGEIIEFKKPGRTESMNKAMVNALLELQNKQ